MISNIQLLIIGTPDFPRRHLHSYGVQHQAKHLIRKAYLLLCNWTRQSICFKLANIIGRLPSTMKGCINLVNEVARSKTIIKKT